ncbi:HTH domain protein [Polystyrenella longa]|uniref:HTH domain protein n=1 Tax=Polystyrenella longa TaxID=2528007 RepID=A0A518CIA2_9PLAN|nr:WYL domain-containing transcriptional regulator [Polystyrenella longa]QDU78894.1 HTH domain protein [Polystyrenella longa]
MSAENRIKRLVRLLDLLQSGHAYNSVQLAELCGISRRTVFRDIRILQDSGVQVLFHEDRQGYTLPGSFFLPPMDLKLNETLSLLLLCQGLGDQQQGIPFQTAAREASFKLLSNLPRHLRDYVGEISSAITLKLDSRAEFKDAEPHFERILQAIVDRRQIRIQYDSFSDGEEISTVCSPYRVLFSRRSWYLIGRSTLHRETRTFHVGRIRNSQTLDSRYEIPQRFSLERYLGNAWHLIREPKEKHTVEVLFQPLVARNVAEVTWHKTQQTTWNDDGTLNFKVQVEGLGEIIWWILGYGNQAEVIKPKKLRRQIAEHLQGLLERYQSELKHV